MARSFDELRNRMSPERRARNDLATRQMLAELLLSQLEHEGSLTEADVAPILEIEESASPGLSPGDDLRVSTLRRLIRSLGGELELVAAMPHGRITLNPGEVRPADPAD